MLNEKAATSILIIREIKQLVEDIYIVFFENKPNKSWSNFMDSFEILTNTNAESKEDITIAVKEFNSQLQNLGEKNPKLKNEKLFLDLKIESNKLWKNITLMDD